jgi:hypothetical protein
MSLKVFFEKSVATLDQLINKVSEACMRYPSLARRLVLVDQSEPDGGIDMPCPVLRLSAACMALESPVDTL